ncbi:MAG TPA: PQQ-dependent sugar dehydrogenase, partial [Methylomirabilota bacterium]|nr:PQQ-dependent sugar dehydrogenase [Methylomirabilota bacterium]
MKFVVVAVGGRVARWIGMLAGLAVSSWAAPGDYPPGPQIARDGTTVWLVDYVRVPPSRRGGSISNFAPPPDYSNQLARVNFLRSEPVDAPLAAARFFVNDLNRNLYILRRADRTWVTYLNFQSIFPRFDNDPGYAGGLVTFAFDPAYASNGVFYTVHTEDPASAAPALPTNLHLPALDLTGYAVTPSEDPPAGTVRRQAVLVEWRDVNITNETFEGTAREVLRIGFNGNSHPLGDLIFNPRARPGDPDYRNLYLACGDGASGEVADARHTIPQRLDALQGKILRLTPDVTQRPDDPLGPNGRYRIPATGSDPNPFIDVALPGLRKEIFALGLRNPHRLSWDAESGALWVNDIGLHSWEEVNLVRKGANYGYAEREGTEELFIGGTNSGLT